ncbi:TPA: ParB-like protein [Stenotrophomonas maltophilia]
MTRIPEPRLSPVAILELRPTQMSVGLLEVQRKRAQWKTLPKQDEERYLGRHMVPVVVGPSGRLYLIDHHHLALALHEEGIEHVLTAVQADLSHLPRKLFWTVMERYCWAHPFDAEGVRQPPSAMPKLLLDLADDPHRSLAGEVRRRGGYAKSVQPFAEFLWADFFRQRMTRKLIRRDFQQAVATACEHARHADARYLPGWCGIERD